MGSKREIKTILIVLFLAILVAGLIAFFFIFYYGPSGSYEAKNTLLDPNIIERINYPEKDPKSGKMFHYMFDRTEATFFDIQKNKIQKINLTSNQYKQLYELVSSDRSIHFITDEILNAFILSSPLQITTYMMMADPEYYSSKKNILQNIQFLENDNYRIQLQGKIESGGWAYFHHPHIYQTIMQMFNQIES
ncbi:MAG: hypothetical protein Q8K60_08510 [Parachlamydiaceae bacterium]|nr:hypothetical protein [Parachlamydiaceae bacterium]